MLEPLYILGAVALFSIGSSKKKRVGRPSILLLPYYSMEGLHPSRPPRTVYIRSLPRIEPYYSMGPLQYQLAKVGSLRPDPFRSRRGL